MTTELRQRYLSDFFDYPIAENRRKALGFLKDDFTRGVVLEDTKLRFDSSNISVMPGYKNAPLYWEDKDNPERKRLKPGDTTYAIQASGDRIKELTIASIEKEAALAGMVVKPEALAQLRKTMILAMTLFSGVVSKYAKRDFKMRAWQVWAPPGGQGRTPLLHVDDSVLTALWYAERTDGEDRKNCGTAQIYTGEMTEEMWQAVRDHVLHKYLRDENRRKRTRFDHALMHQDKIHRLRSAFGRSADPADFVATPSGSILITRNLLDENSALRSDTPSTRQTICPHRSDGMQFGQVGLVMVPEFIKS